MRFQTPHFTVMLFAIMPQTSTSFSATSWHKRSTSKHHHGHHHRNWIAVKTPFSPSELMMSPETALTEIDALWQSFPYTAAAIVCGCKASAADWVAQSSTATTTTTTDSPSTVVPQQHHDELDHKRNFAFLLYGVLYQGIAHEYIFNDLYPVWFGTGSEWTVVATKVMFNLLIQTTLVTLPFAYILKGLIADQHHDVHAAVQKYLADIQYQGLLTRCFLVWGPAHCLTFTIVPEHWRVTFVAAVSFFWLITLSTISAREAGTTSGAD